ncbi:MAG: hypothetical protein HFE66_02055 [Clostridiales bacterium]|jgi:RNA-binding protein YlmH|nr:hypothetical protein [Clostridiales bacterium]
MMTENSPSPGGVRITEEERLLIARGAELSARAEHSAVASSFLSPRQQRILFDSALREKRADQLFFWGGCLGASRRMAVYLPTWILSFAEDAPPASPAQLFTQDRESYFLHLLTVAGMEESIEHCCGDPYEFLPEKLEEIQEEGLLSAFVHPLLLKGSGFRALSHRDWLGSLMSLGIKREILGDIVIWDDFHAVVFCQTRGASYLISELKKAGRDAVHAVPCRLPAGFVPRQQYTSIHGTVASPRADGVIRILCNVSREDAANLIQRGMVEINYDLIEETDRRMEPGDIISVRGYGKFRIDEIGRPTTRGRLHLTAQKYQ